MNSNFTKERNPNGVLIPNSALKMAKLFDEDKLGLYVQKNTLILLKRRMTAMELINAICCLGNMAERLIDHLIEACGQCQECGDSCPMDSPDGEKLTLPDALRQAANIPEGAKLCAGVDAENGAVVITAADNTYDLSDVSEDMLDFLLGEGVCMGKLEQHLEEEDIIYGE